jgi:hypothetical protein
MKCHIEISSIAESEAHRAFLRLSQLISPTGSDLVVVVVA